MAIGILHQLQKRCSNRINQAIAVPVCLMQLRAHQIFESGLAIGQSALYLFGHQYTWLIDTFS